jgi:type IV pilus assembly protein PilE
MIAANHEGPKGFTLIELMIVVAIIGILASIAYPSYLEYVKKSNRAEATVVLMESAQALERFYSVNGSYLDSGSVASVFPTNVPASGVGNYTVAATGARNSFTLTATPTGSMSGDDCGNLSITHSGVKGASGSKGVADCW